MTKNDKTTNFLSGHRSITLMVLCLFGVCLLLAMSAPRKRHRPKTDERIYLVHSDELKYDMYGSNPDAQIVKGRVHFLHKGGHLWCDSAYFFQESNSVKAFGHVRYKQGDTLSLTCEYADYDGQEQMVRARRRVVLRHRRQTLYTDSLDYDRIYKNAYFFEGGELVDGHDRLVADWGEYNTETRKSAFYYGVKMRTPRQTITTDTLFYDTRKSVAHVTGPSKILTQGNVIHTSNAYLNTRTDLSELFGRSTVVNKEKSITGDSLYHNNKSGYNEGFGNVIYIDRKNCNELHGNHVFYNETTGYGFATKKALMIDYSQKDTLYVHGDSLKIYTFNIKTDSVYRTVHGFDHVRAYRRDVQAVCDSLVFDSRDSCMTMYRDPIAWNSNRQILGEVIKIYMNDSTIRRAEVIGQALSVEQIDAKDHFNQVSSKRMDAFFTEGNLRLSVASGNVKSIYYVADDKDSSLTELNYLETDTLKMFLSPQRQLEKIWAPKSVATMYPITQVPPDKYRLPEFAWFDKVRPVSKDDIFVWRGKGEGKNLKTIVRQAAPLQQLNRKQGKTVQ